MLYFTTKMNPIFYCAVPFSADVFLSDRQIVVWLRIEYSSVLHIKTQIKETPALIFKMMPPLIRNRLRSEKYLFKDY